MGKGSIFVSLSAVLIMFDNVLSLKEWVVFLNLLGLFMTLHQDGCDINFLSITSFWNLKHQTASYEIFATFFKDRRTFKSDLYNKKICEVQINTLTFDFLNDMSDLNKPYVFYITSDRKKGLCQFLCTAKA